MLVQLVVEAGAEMDSGSAKAFVIFPAHNLPEEFDQGGFAGAGQAGHFQEGKALGLFAHLFGEQRHHPVAEVGAKDEFLNIKDVTAQDLLAAHRTPPVLIGMVPKNTGGFGNVTDAAAVFYELEITPIQMRMMEVNDWLGVQAVTFERPPIAIQQSGSAETPASAARA